MTFKTFFENKNISYSGVVLDENSRKRLLSSPEIKNYLNPEHDLIAHHMTIKLGGLMGTIHEKRIDTVEDFFANSVGISPSTPEEKINEIVYNVENLPDSYVKRNLMLTIAGEYGGYSEDLFHLLKPFSEMNLKEMSK
jgi:hypothetical protein